MKGDPLTYKQHLELLNESIPATIMREIKIILSHVRYVLIPFGRYGE